MTGTGHDPLRAWAARQLEVAEDATPADARAAFLQRLESDEFVPPMPVQWAMRALMDSRPASSPWLAEAEDWARLEDEKRLRDSIEDFADRFWRLSIDERRDEHARLVERAGHAPMLAARLQQLDPTQAEIARPDPAFDSPEVVALAERVCEFAVMRPMIRFRARQSWLVEQLGSMADWRRAAKTLRASYPRIAALQPEFVKELARWKRPSAPRRPARQPAAAATGQNATGGGWALVWIVGLVISGVVGALSSSQRPNYRPTTPPSVPKYQLPTRIDYEKREFVYPDGRRESVDRWGEATRQLFGFDESLAKDKGKSPRKSTPSQDGTPKPSGKRKSSETKDSARPDPTRTKTPNSPSKPAKSSRPPEGQAPQP